MRFIEVPDHRRRPTPLPVDCESPTELFAQARTVSPPAVWVDLDDEEHSLDRVPFPVSAVPTPPPKARPSLSSRVRTWWASFRWQVNVWMHRGARQSAFRKAKGHPPTS